MIALELKAAVSVDEAGTITGMAWPFGTPDRMGDEIMPGAFKGAKAPLPLLAFHRPDDPIGVWESITETAKGLAVSGRLLVDDLARAREVRALVKSGAVTGLNPGFGGQGFIPAMVEKVRQVKALIGSRPIDIEIDGGITAQTAPLVAAAGANVLVAGSAVFGGGTAEAYAGNIDSIRTAADRAVGGGEA